MTIDDMELFGFGYAASCRENTSLRDDERSTPPSTICLMRWLRLQKETSRQADSLPKKSKGLRAACSKIWPILTWEAICLHDLWAFLCNQSLWSCAMSIRSIQYTLAEWWRPRFLRSMGPSSTISNRITYGNDPGRIVSQNCRLQTVMALCDQESVRILALPSYQRLEAMVRRHIDQMTRTRNVKAPNERIETGVLVESHKGKNVNVERKVRECYQWKAKGQCSKGDSCSFRYDVASGNGRTGQRAKARSSSHRNKFEGQDWQRDTLKKFKQRRWKLFRQKEQNSVPIQKLW